VKKLLIAASVLLLVFATVTQADRQRAFMHVQAHNQSDGLRNRAYFVGAYPNTLGIEDGFESFGGNINMVGVLFHPDDLDQPPVYTIAAGPRLTGNESPEEVRGNRQFARLEEAALEHARELISSFDEQGLPTMFSGYNYSNSNRFIHLRFGGGDLNPSDEGFHFTWIAEAFPLRAALIQMIPVYLAAAALLAALFLPQRKNKTTPKENLDA